MASEKTKNAKKPITYYYNPFNKLDGELQFLEVWQVLNDDVLGDLYPWQYVATAELSNRIVNLNFLALKNFENDYRKYYDQLFLYKVSAKLLSEGNVHRLGSILQPNLILCFDIYQLEKFGDKLSLMGIKFLQNIGATIMISGVDKAPVDILLKYPAQYYLLDYRYYSEQNKGLITMMKQLAEANAVTLIVGNVNNKDNLDMFKECGIEIFSGSALIRPRKKVDTFLGQEETERVELAEAEDGTKRKYIIKDVDAPEVKDRAKAKKEEEISSEEVTLNVTTQRDLIKARLAAIAQAKAEQKLQESKEQKPINVGNTNNDTKLEKKSRIDNKENEAKVQATKLGAGKITTSTDEFASLNKNKTQQKQVKRGENVIKLNISKPNKKR
ncbi:MAG: EAL domain-containing protein [Clostridia bacterium]|nr:EAL domain-containing protein [Clostridia bacterium]